MFDEELEKAAFERAVTDAFRMSITWRLVCECIRYRPTQTFQEADSGLCNIRAGICTHG